MVNKALPVVIATIICATALTPPMARGQNGSLRALDQQLSAAGETLGIPGMSAAIAQRGKIVWARGWGLADRERSARATPDTLYHLASVTKPYAATVILELSEEGKLDLNRPVADFGVTIGTADTPVRVWHLLSHYVHGHAWKPIPLRRCGIRQPNTRGRARDWEIVFSRTDRSNHPTAQPEANGAQSATS